MNNMSLYVGIFLTAVVVSCCSQILLKKSANKHYNSPREEYLNPYVIIAYTLYFATTLITMLAYKRIPMSMGPILESTGYVLIPVMSRIFLKERMSKRQLTGMGVILLGVLVFNI